MSVADRIRAAAGAATESQTAVSAANPAPAAQEIPLYDTPEAKPTVETKSTPVGKAEEYEFSDSDLADLLDEEDDVVDEDSGLPPAEDHSAKTEEVGEQPVVPDEDEAAKAKPDETLETATAPVEETPEAKAAREAAEAAAAAATPPEQTAEAPVVPEPAPQPGKTPEELQAEFTKTRDALVESLAAETYQITDDEATAMITDPEKVLPKLLAKVHTNVLASMAQGIATQVPEMIQQVNYMNQVRQEYDQAFYKQWPKLAEHRDTVERVSAVYQQLNPKATMKEAMQEIGAQAMVMLRIPIEGQPIAVPDAGAPVAGETPPSTPPPAPAAVGGAGAPAKPAPATQGNIFSEMAEEWLEDGD